MPNEPSILVSWYTDPPVIPPFILSPERAYSSRLRGADTLAGLDWLAGTSYARAAMERRRQLIAIRAGRQRGRQSSPLLSKSGPGHLNPRLWGGSV